MDPEWIIGGGTALGGGAAGFGFWLFKQVLMDIKEDIIEVKALIAAQNGRVRKNEIAIASLDGGQNASPE